MNKIKKTDLEEKSQKGKRVLQQTAQGGFRRSQLDCPHEQVRQETITNKTTVFDISIDKETD